jgi:hypothetical protein
MIKIEKIKKMTKPVVVWGSLLLAIGPMAWSQADPPPVADSSAMVAPAPVSSEGYSLDFSSETPRTNYLSGGVIVGAAYDDGIVFSGGGVSDVSYSVSPTIALDVTRSRLRWNVTYSPGFTFYQKYSDLNQSNENVAAKFSYRLSPHVTFSAQEIFSKTSGSYNPSCGTVEGSLCGPLQSPNSSIVAPVTDTLNNASNAQLTYQFSPGGMVGVTGNFSELLYPGRNQTQAAGLFDSNAAGGSAFYTHRLSGKHYVGVTYQYQKYLTHADPALDPIAQATQTQSVMLFYTLYLQHAWSFSLFGGPQYSDTYGQGLAPLRSWSPGGGASLNWQGQHNSLLVTYSRKITDGGGLAGAVSYNGTDASIRHRFSPALTASISANYSVNKVLDPTTVQNTGGHSISGTVLLQRNFGEHFNATAGYLRLHQSYDIASLAVVPDRDRVWLSIGYRFQRALGR